MTAWRLALLLLALANPAWARDLPVPMNNGWKHAITGVVLMPRVAGLSRTRLTDATETEHDIAASFGAADGSLVATVYLFHPAISDVGMWFDRSLSAITESGNFPNAQPLTATPEAFSLAGAAVPTGLRQSYALAGDNWRSTALAVVPVTDWLVAIRVTSAVLTAPDLSEKLMEIITGLKLPAPATAGSPVRPMAACATALTFRKARVVKANMGDLLISLMGASAAAQPPATAAPVQWCKDPASTAEYGVYRASDADANDGYTIAIGDAGRAINVSPALVASAGNRATFSISMIDVDGTSNSYQSMTPLPAPEQVWGFVGTAKPIGSSQGNNITLPMPPK